ncbi:MULTISPECIES: BRO-N domain-containing protein [Chromobacteriaceae]|uniref:Bro-N domain-containing protein n=1 Tax=Pseudogulbenkiania ferrooxidans EGD-HP2 TaxID=1388764 RepID=A0ABN0N7K4_9NEIS|nr:MULTISPECIES: BRO family protein [Chromobacteriaceae]ERE07222.1 hypothetical protein O166_06640 [Pseudogulbenkiania ferrooxidans EGD-HP2]QRO34113.1 hypothetical protein I6K04_05040 [Chromobacterium violaceum]QRQ16084.1 hypothetical protein I6K03_17690 [Chromobacterium violaceum]
MQLVPFEFDGRSIRVITDAQGEVWFVGKDVCQALGYADHANALKQHCKGVAKRHPLQTAGGVQEVRVLAEPDVLRLIVSSSLPAAEAFEHWVFEDVLPSIRKTGGYVVAMTAKPELEAFKLIPVAVRAARALGLDRNAAAISANQAVNRLTGMNVMQLLGHTHLEAEQQMPFFTPTQLGERIGISGRKLNLLLAEAGLQAKQGDDWSPLPAAEGFFRFFDTSKRHGSGAPVLQLKWAEHVLDLIEQAA